MGVLRAFGAGGDPVLLAGGQRTSWRAGRLVLKPAGDPRHAQWAAELMSAVPENGFRVARPVRSADGKWVVDGWTASRLVAGQAAPHGRWLDLLHASRAFHQVVGAVPRPGHLAGRQDRWAQADRGAWGEAAIAPSAAASRVAQALRSLAGVGEGRPQLVHGDLSGNVLFSHGLPPAIIDLSPYWRPVGYAEGIVVADAVLRWNEGPEWLEASGVRRPDVARGALFRLLDEVLQRAAGDEDRRLRPYRRLIALLER